MVAALAVLAVGLSLQGTKPASAAGNVGLPPRPVRAALLDLPPQPRVLLIGDSYTEGKGAVPLSEGYAFHIAEPLGWSLTRDGIGGTGYVNVGPRGQGTYAERLWRHPSDAYDLVVLEGGSNDDKTPAAELAPAVDATLRAVRQRYPSAQLLLLGPSSPYGVTTTDRAKTNEVLVRATRANSLLYINPIAERWFVRGDGRVMANPDNFHPSNAGHARIAQLFVRDVQALTYLQPAH